MDWPTPKLDQFRRELIDELAVDQGFDPSALAGRMAAFVREGDKEASAQRRRASLLVGELARLFRGVLWQTAGLEPPCPDPADRRAALALASRLEPEDVFVLADRCMEAAYHLQRNLYLPMVLESLFHDLGKVINARQPWLEPVQSGIGSILHGRSGALAIVVRVRYDTLMSEREFLQVDPAMLHLPGGRQDGVDPMKLHRQNGPPRNVDRGHATTGGQPWKRWRAGHQRRSDPSKRDWRSIFPAFW